MNINTSISQTNYTLEKTLFFRRKLKKEKNSKTEKTNTRSKSSENILINNFTIQNNYEDNIAPSISKDPEMKNKQLTHSSQSSLQSSILRKYTLKNDDTSTNDLFPKDRTPFQESKLSINSYISNLKITECSDKTSDFETFLDLKTSSTQSINNVCGNDKNSTYNTYTKESNSISSVSEKSNTGFFNTVISAAQNAANSLTSLTTHRSLRNKKISEKLNNSKNSTRNDLGSITNEFVAEDFLEKKNKELDINIIPSIGSGKLSLNDVKILEDIDKSHVFTDNECSDNDFSFSKRLQENPNNKIINYNSNQKKNHTSSLSQNLTYKKINSARKSTCSSVPCLDRQNTIHLLIQQITGITVANSKRNKEFHTLFQSVPEDSYLIDDYASALQKDILLHGRMYISETYICFNSNIFGWITNLIISFSEIVSIDKKSTAIVFPNAIQITTLHAKYMFSSFISRDTTYDLLISIWRLINPSTRTLITEVNIDDKNNENYENFTKTKDLNDQGFEINSTQNNEGINADENSIKEIAKTSYQNFSKENYLTTDDINLDNKSLGYTERQPTECSCLLRNEHYEKQICDETIKGPLPEVVNLCFGEDLTFMYNFLENVQKVSEIKLSKWKKDDLGKKTRHINYLKPLYGPVGPKQTHCKIVETIEHEDNNYVSVSSITKTPDVPSGNSFVVKTKYCMMWDKNNYTRIIATCTTDWTKSSWLKSPIEKGANEGQISYIKDLIDTITNSLKRPINEKSLEKKTIRKLQKLYKIKNTIDNKKNQIIYDKNNSELKLKLFNTLKSTFNTALNIFLFVIKPNNIIIVLLLIILFKITQLEKIFQNMTHLTNIDYKTLNHYNSLWKQGGISEKCLEPEITYNFQIPKQHSSSFFDNKKKDL
ncbi:hypothetical protein T552_03153 [Pneumocystis carinii B80]|uniref:VASt domain-containing protein n=1 Tax=Pneumocystis carinii (strain B80) TaxID=1408658 RepID=A0A0W4ZC27_PNEC8|nr:hypothetical protein T552_03153 [Pneumocystis carinii B80]KTW25879.1 hypothetical protein T552_03153 [Pneumocystis carinii B80]